MRLVLRLAPLALAAALLAPGAQAATPTATTAAPSVPTQPQQAPGSAFSPLTGGVDQGTQTDTTVAPSKRAGDTSDGHGTLIFLTLVALILIGGVGFFIWWEGRKNAQATKRHRQRMRSGRTPQALAATSGDARRGPPPPPRKRHQQAKRKKR